MLDGFEAHDFIFEVLRSPISTFLGFAPRIKVARMKYLMKPLHSLHVAILQNDR